MNVEEMAKQFQGEFFKSSGEEASENSGEPEQVSATEVVNNEESEGEPLEPTPIDSGKYKVKVNGEEFELTLDELRQGYLKNADYTTKTMEVSKQRKELEAKAAEVDSKLEDARLLIEMEIDELKGPEWEPLQVSDPTKYWKEVDRIKKKAEKFETMKNEQLSRLEAKQKALLEKEQESLFNAVPDWLDEPTRNKEMQSAIAALQGVGFTNDDSDKLNDHRLFVLARKAAKYDELMNADPKAKQEKVAGKTIKGDGSKITPDKNSSVKEKFAKTGKVADAAAYLESLLR